MNGIYKTFFLALLVMLGFACSSDESDTNPASPDTKEKIYVFNEAYPEINSDGSLRVIGFEFTDGSDAVFHQQERGHTKIEFLYDKAIDAMDSVFLDLSDSVQLGGYTAVYKVDRNVVIKITRGGQGTEPGKPVVGYMKPTDDAIAFLPHDFHRYYRRSPTKEELAQIVALWNGAAIDAKNRSFTALQPIP